MIKYRYGWEQLHKATDCLIGDGPLKERLVGAALAGISHITPSKDLPPYLQTEFLELEALFLEKNPEKEGEGKIHASVRHMDQSQQHAAAEKILSLYDSICRTLGAQHPDDYL